MKNGEIFFGEGDITGLFDLTFLLSLFVFFHFFPNSSEKNKKYSENRENMRKNEIYLNFYDNNKIYQTIHLK